MIQNPCKPLSDWTSLLKTGGGQLHAHSTLAEVKRVGSNSPLFSFLEIEATAGDGRKLPTCLLLRGHAVIVVPILIDSKSQKRFVILVKQNRIATGASMTELPAGMMDHEKDALKVAQKEFEEEVGFELGETTLIPLNETPLYTSPGLLDEGIFYFYFEKTIDPQALLKLKGQVRGCEVEGEHIELSVATLEEAHEQMTSIPSLYGLSLYERKRINR